MGDNSIPARRLQREKPVIPGLREAQNPESSLCLARLPNAIFKKLDSGSPLRGVRNDGASQRRDGWLQPVLADTRAYLNHPHDFR